MPRIARPRLLSSPRRRGPITTSVSAILRFSPHPHAAAYGSPPSRGRERSGRVLAVGFGSVAETSTEGVRSARPQGITEFTEDSHGKDRGSRHPIEGGGIRPQ